MTYLEKCLWSNLKARVRRQGLFVSLPFYCKGCLFSFKAFVNMHREKEESRAIFNLVYLWHLPMFIFVAASSQALLFEFNAHRQHSRWVATSTEFYLFLVSLLLEGTDSKINTKIVDSDATDVSIFNLFNSKST